MKTMSKILKAVLAISFGLFCFAGGWVLNGRYGVQKQVSDRIPTVEEIQRLVGANPDGKIGPETMAKWERAVCDQYAKQYFQPQITHPPRREVAGEISPKAEINTDSK